MLPRCNHNALFGLLLLDRTCYCQQRTVHSCQSLTQSLPNDKVPSQRIHLNGRNFVLKVCIGVWVAIAEEHHVFVVLKSVSERGSEVKFQKPVVLADVVFEIGYVAASSVPPHSLVLGLFLAV